MGDSNFSFGSTLSGSQDSVIRKTFLGRLHYSDSPKTVSLPGESSPSEYRAALLAKRGIEDVEGFLQPQISRHMPDPYVLQDLERGVHFFTEAVRDKSSIGIIGDYDVDGATSVSQVCLYLGFIGHEEFGFHIPQRLTDGYGPNVNAVQNMHEAGVNLLMILDSGTIAYEPVELALSLGMKVIIMDHHEPGAGWIPPGTVDGKANPNIAIINPKRPDDNSSLDYLCTAGLAMIFLVGVSRHMRESLHYEASQLPPLMDMMGIVALGTVADVVPLIGLNRAFVVQGLKKIDETTGLKSLRMATGTFGKPATSMEMGFILGPCINAGGRIGDCMRGSLLLTEYDEGEALTKAQDLLDANTTRKEMQASALKKVFDSIPEDSNNSVIIAYDDEWHPGLVGIIAAKVRERYNRPAVVIGTGGKGSGRNAHGFDIGNAFIEAAKAGILKKGGGHAAAGGLTIDPARLSEFQDYMDARAANMVEEPGAADIAMSLDDLTAEVVQSIQMLEPFGMGNADPVYELRDCFVTGSSELKNNHLKIFLENKYGNKIGAIVFGAIGTPLGDYLVASEGKTITVLATVDLFREKPSLKISDIVM